MNLTNKKIAIVVSRFNEFITQKLLAGCLTHLAQSGILKKNITVVWVPGAFEIPLVALKLAKRKDVAAVIALGAIVKGETHHFELVAQESARGLMDVSLTTQKPVIFEILSVKTLEQAYKRCGVKGPNKGESAACCALDMIKTLSHA